MWRTSIGKRKNARAVGVKSVEVIGKQDVYNMEVAGTHCFSVNGGAIVHNCMDDIRYFVYTILRHKLGKKSERNNPFDLF